MSAEALSTQPLPPPAPESGAPQEHEPQISVNPREDVLSQVQDFARNKDRANIEGVRYTQGGVTYEVTGDITHHITEPIKIMRRFAPTFSRQIGGAHTIVQEPTQTEWITVKGYRDDEFVDRKQFRASEFAAYLNDHMEDRVGSEAPDGYIDKDSFYLGAAVPKPESRAMMTPEDVKPQEKETVLDAVIRVQEDNRLPGFEGLTWARDGFPHRIIEDDVRLLPDGHGPRLSRELVMEVRDRNGRIMHQHVLTIDQLSKHLQVMVTQPKDKNIPPNPPLDDLRFEVPKKKLSDTPYPAGDALSEADAAAILLSGDLYNRVNKAQRQAVDIIKNSTDGYQDIRNFQAMVGELAAQELENLAHMLQQYYTAAKKFGLSRDQDMGAASILTELARQLQLSDGLLGNGGAALEARRAIVDRAIGQGYAGMVLRGEVVQAKQNVKIPEAERQFADEEYREAIKDVRFVALDKMATGWLPLLIRDEVIKILSQAESTRQNPEGRQLTGDDLGQIGKLLGRATNLRLHN